MSRLDSTIRRSLDLGPEVDLETVAYRETAVWDSVAHLQLLLALEEAFSLALEPDDAMAMTDYQRVRDVMARHVGRDDL